MQFSQRAALAANPTAKKLLQLIADKESNLCLSADFGRSAELLQFAERLGDEICVLKTHIDILSDFTPAVTEKLLALSEKHHFLLFEDRKFADIGHTVQHQYGNGIYRIADWAAITNAHLVPGPGIIEGLQKVGLAKGNGLLLLAEMSSQGSLTDSNWANTAVTFANRYPEFVMGFISQHRLSDNPGLIHMTPGVQFAASGDDLGQQYVTPEQAIQQRGSDVIIVGRGIYQAIDPLKTARDYRLASWQALKQQQNVSRQ